jgi:ABC-2 type transport system ATP-binding protein
MDNNISVRNLCKQLEDFSLDNVSFDVPKGRIVGFIGENGAGKSTTINLILNEMKKTRYLKKFKIPTTKTIGNFSKGMKMKLSIICAMAHRPKLLILDEATTGLDPIVRDEVLDLFLEFIQDEDCSIFFSSHITSDIQKIADYVILIHQGKIIFEEEKDDLVYNYGVAKCGKEAFKRKYRNVILDSATLEDIMLFYAKGDTSCAD